MCVCVCVHGHVVLWQADVAEKYFHTSKAHYTQVLQWAMERLDAGLLGGGLTRLLCFATSTTTTSTSNTNETEDEQNTNR